MLEIVGKVVRINGIKLPDGISTFGPFRVESNDGLVDVYTRSGVHFKSALESTGHVPTGYYQDLDLHAPLQNITDTTRFNATMCTADCGSDHAVISPDGLYTVTGDDRLSVSRPSTRSSVFARLQR